MTVKQAESVSDIFNKYRVQLKNYISKRVFSKEDGEDILQNVFYQLSKADLIEKPIEQMAAWLYSVANNQIIETCFFLTNPVNPFFGLFKIF